MDPLSRVPIHAQLVMTFLSTPERLLLARCSKTLRTLAQAPWVWKDTKQTCPIEMVGPNDTMDAPVYLQGYHNGVRVTLPLAFPIPLWLHIYTSLHDATIDRCVQLCEKLRGVRVLTFEHCSVHERECAERLLRLFPDVARVVLHLRRWSKEDPITPLAVLPALHTVCVPVSQDYDDLESYLNATVDRVVAALSRVRQIEFAWVHVPSAVRARVQARVKDVVAVCFL